MTQRCHRRQAPARHVPPILHPFSTLLQPNACTPAGRVTAHALQPSRKGALCAQARGSTDMADSSSYNLALSSIGRSLHADSALHHGPASTLAAAARRQQEPVCASLDSVDEVVADAFDDFDFVRPEQHTPRSTAGAPHGLAPIPEQQGSDGPCGTLRPRPRQSRPAQMPQPGQQLCPDAGHTQASPPAAAPFSPGHCRAAVHMQQQQQQQCGHPLMPGLQAPVPLPSATRPPARHRHRRQNAILSGDGSFDFPDWELGLQAMQPV